MVTSTASAVTSAPEHASSVAEDRALIEAWITEVLPGVLVTQSLSAADATAEGHIALSLFDLAPVADVRRNLDLPSRLAARYLVLPQHPDPTVAHDQLATLLFAAAEQSRFVVESDPVDPAWWPAIGLTLQPTLRITTMILRPRPQPADVRLVEEPLVLQVTDVDGSAP